MKRVALVIGSGGMKCAAAIGLWRLFEREGIGISMCVGASGGSLYAGTMALGMGLQEVEQLSRDFWTNALMEGYAHHLKAVQSGEMAFTERSGLADDGPLNARLQAVFGGRDFADARTPLYVVSTDFATGEAVLHQSGSLFDAIRASVAIPLIFPPWSVDGRLLTDGAVSNPLPVDVAMREGADVIVAMGFDIPTRPRLRSYTQVTQHFNALYMNNILKASFSFNNLVHHAEVIAILPEFERPVSGFDGAQVDYVIECGERATETQLDYIKQLLGSTDDPAPL